MPTTFINSSSLHVLLCFRLVVQVSLMSFPPPLNRRNDQRRLYFTALAQGTHAAANTQVHGSVPP